MGNEEQRQALSQQSETSRSGIWTTVTIVVSLVSGGAMGALISHYYATRQTVVSYAINTTSLGAAETTKSVLPTLKLQLDNVEIPAVYTHTIELSHGGGPELDQALVSITLAGAKLYGSPIASGPDPVHQIGCKHDATISTIICSVGRVTTKNKPYRITLATDRVPTISLAIDGKNTTIEQSSVAGPQVTPGYFLGYLAIGVLASVVAALLSEFIQRFRHYRMLKKT